ncbi:methyltransferase-domain-containing protein [Pisolithus croceorrhizus]|nr:methyltransferase-domain-containing protein [Pisolithus croceorrhizus]
MALFDVPGWTVPTEPTPAQAGSKKRKRRQHSPDDIQSAQANLDKLVRMLGHVPPEGDPRPLKKKKSRAKVSQGTLEPKKVEVPTPEVFTPKDGVARSKTKTDRQHKGSKNSKSSATEKLDPPDPSSERPLPVQEKSGLTPLQKHMKQNLGGAHFRLINEKLYKSHSAEAVEMMKKDPKVFRDVSNYHDGFRHQVQSWPSNPVSHYIDEFSRYPPKTVIADLGCGDAALAKALHPKNLNILSFDLLSDGAFVVEADICSRLPLPGSEPLSVERTEGEGQIVDVVVCALSLMSTNWPGCIREAWRILRPGGELRIAEVVSRFTAAEDFVSLVRDVGFKLKKKDDRNTHFTLFQFKKVARATILDQEWSALLSRGGVLKPCEYKRR